MKSIKILVETFRERVRESNNLNWNEVIQKMENRINKFVPKQLSLHAKAILLNTLILAKTTCMSNVFPISPTTFNKYI